MAKRLYLKLCPELFDGVQHEILAKSEVALYRVREWLQEWDAGCFGAGDAIMIEVVEMEECDFDRLPEL